MPTFLFYLALQRSKICVVTSPIPIITFMEKVKFSKNNGLIFWKLDFLKAYHITIFMSQPNAIRAFIGNIPRSYYSSHYLLVFDVSKKNTLKLFEETFQDFFQGICIIYA